MAGRRSFIQFEGKFYEKGVDELPESYYARRASFASTDSALWSDRHYEGLRAPDGEDISSRTKHREYMRRKGLTTVDDFTNHFREAEKRRSDFYQTGGDHAARREAIERSIYELVRRK